MTQKEAIKEALDIYDFTLPDEIKKDPQKIHAIISIASLLLSREDKKTGKRQKVKA